MEDILEQMVGEITTIIDDCVGGHSTLAAAR